MGRRRRRSAKQAPPAVTHANSLFSARNSVLNVPELLSLIFVHVFEAFALSMTTFIFDRNLTTSFNAIPLRLSQVCQRWYVIAKSTPRIWTWIDLKLQNRALDGKPETHTGRLQKYLDCWLERSGGLPLSVCARFYDAALFAKLLQHAHRWRNVHFGFTVRNAFPILEKPISTLLASLENLELELGYELEPLDNPEGWTSVINLANLARLSSLHIIGRNPEEALSLRPPSSLKTLKLTHGTFLLLPVRMPSLISLEFDQSTLRSLPEDTVFDRARTLTLRDTPLRPDIFPKLHILFPHLTTLTVLRIENEDYNDDFTYDGLVELPALQSLSVPCQHPLISNLVAPSLAEITWAGSYEDNPLDLRVLIRRSRCQRTLQSFKIEGPIDHEEAVIYVLEEMPSLVKLDVLMDQVSERILFALTVPDKQPSQTVDTVDDISDLEEIPWHLPPKSYLGRVFCPRLTTLILRAEKNSQGRFVDENVSADPERLVKAAVGLIISKQDLSASSQTSERKAMSGNLQRAPLQKLVLPLGQRKINKISSNQFVRKMPMPTHVESAWTKEGSLKYF